MEWIDERKALLEQGTQEDDVTPYLDIIELYRKAIADYLCRSHTTVLRLLYLDC